MGVVLVDENGEPVGTNQFYIWPDNAPAAELFYASYSQWQRNSMTGHLIGLNYPGVESAARMASISITPELFSNLQIIEQGALGITPDYPELADLTITRVEFPDHDEAI